MRKVETPNGRLKRDQTEVRVSSFSACALFQRCLQERGNEDWCQFQKRYGQDLEKMVRGALRRHRTLVTLEVEDILQEIFCRILASRRQTFEGNSDWQLWAYLRKVLSNLLIDQTRRRSWIRSRWKRLHDLHIDAPTPEELTVRRDAWRQLAAFAALAVRTDHHEVEMRALRMVLLEGCSSRQAAQSTDLTPQRVDRLVGRLRRKMLDAGLELPRRSPVQPRSRSARLATRDHCNE
jgi:RNA polymerase sigma factor (sigma-70 family)